MTTPTGTISLSDVNVELGRSSTASINMNESAVRTLAGVGGSGTIISMNDLRGKSNLAATLNQYSAMGSYDIVMERTIVQLYASYVEAYVKLVLNSNGTAYYQYGDSNTATTNYTSFTWKTGGGVVGDYYAYMTTPSGDSFAGGSSATNSALALSSTREWVLLASAGNGSEMTVANNSTIQIRNSSGTVLASRTVSMYAFASAPSF